MKYRLSEKAITDLEKIWFYSFNKWSKEQADRYHNLIVNEIEFIVENFNLSRQVDHIRTGYRMTKVRVFMKLCLQWITINFVDNDRLNEFQLRRL